jgi:hypothetical protein
MRKSVTLVAVALLAMGCFQKSDPNVSGPGTPDPTAADSVSPVGDVAEWACNVDGDCGDLVAGPCQEALCLAGTCVAQDVVPGTLCDFAQATDCVRGVCQMGADGLACVGATAANGTPCGEFYAACQGAGGCLDGVCQDPCDDGNPCTDGSCTQTGCVFTSNTAACNDGDVCTANDTCVDGLCQGEKVCDCSEDADCAGLNDGNLCTGTYECKNNGTCGIKQSTVVSCEETGFEPCQANVCNPENGQCDLVVAEDGAECDDLIECTDGDFCVAGECTGIAAITCEWQCDDQVDEDDDGLMDCEEPECWGVDPCPQPECGDDNCTALADEDCASCPEDCGECPPECGDGKLQLDNDEECDDGNPDSNDGCDSLCKVEPAPAAVGALVITEILNDPENVLDAAGEWFEVYNTTDAPIDINAWTLEDTGTDSHRIYQQGGVIVPANGYFVLGTNADVASNGGVTVDYEYGNFNLANKDDEVTLKSGDVVIDVVAYDDSVTFPNNKAIAMSLSPGKVSAVDNDDGANWCKAQDSYGGVDLGTPGAANPECPSCGDDVCNEDEDCGSCPGDCDCGAGFECLDSNCVALTANGGSCGSPADCASGFCVDGLCCDSACDGICQECDSSGNKGKCIPIWADSDPDDECGTCQVCSGQSSCKFVTAGLDIKNDCTKEAAQTCGFDGSCDGAGSCAFWDDETVAEAQKCNGNTAHAPDLCDGLGGLVDGGSSDCCPYKCAGPVCAQSCVTKNDCCGAATCDAGQCVL